MGVVTLFWELVLVEARRQNFDVRWVGIHEELEVFFRQLLACTYSQL
jgi:hypothetical protein